jgi:hypothetical protein
MDVHLSVIYLAKWMIILSHVCVTIDVVWNTGTVTVSLYYTFQISHIKSSPHSHILATTFFTASSTELNYQLTLFLTYNISVQIT